MEDEPDRFHYGWITPFPIRSSQNARLWLSFIKTAIGHCKGGADEKGKKETTALPRPLSA